MARRPAHARALALLIVVMLAGAVATSTAVAQSQDPSGGQAYQPNAPDPNAPAGRARLASAGRAVAPPDAPPQVVAIIAAANRIARKPYRYGGGHGRFRDRGYDCSGSVSYALRGAGLLSRPLDSSGFMRWGEAGPGKWVTVYAHGGHAYMVVAGLRFDTSGRSSTGSRWQRTRRSTSGYRVRHPAGL